GRERHTREMVMRAWQIARYLGMAKRSGAGGPSWTRSRTTGAGVSAAVSAAPDATVTGYAVRAQADMLAAAPAQTPIPIGIWRWYGASGQDILAHDTLTSQADSAIAFLVRDIDTDAGLMIVTIDPKR